MIKSDNQITWTAILKSQPRWQRTQGLDLPPSCLPRFDAVVRKRSTTSASVRLRATSYEITRRASKRAVKMKRTRERRLGRKNDSAAAGRRS